MSTLLQIVLIELGYACNRGAAGLLTCQTRLMQWVYDLQGVSQRTRDHRARQSAIKAIELKRQEYNL